MLPSPARQAWPRRGPPGSPPSWLRARCGMASPSGRLSSRERVTRAVDHREGDRVPIDLGGMKATGIAVGAYQRVRDLLGLRGATRVLHPRFMIAEVQEDVRRRFRA